MQNIRANIRVTLVTICDYCHLKKTYFMVKEIKNVNLFRIFF